MTPVSTQTTGFALWEHSKKALFSGFDKNSFIHLLCFSRFSA